MALIAATALAVVWTWPVAAHLSSRVPHDPGDPILNAWILWWNAQAIPLTERWWNPPIFVPLAGAIALSEHLLGLSVVATPLQLAGAGPLTAYNVLLLSSYALSAFFTYLLAYRLTGSTLAAACAGVAFGFTPYRAGQVAHIQVLTSQWMPAMLLGMHGYMDTGARRWLALFGVSWLLQALSNGYYMLFLPALILPWLAWFTPWRTGMRKALAIAGTWIVSSLPLAPVLSGYYFVHESLGLGRDLGDIRQFSATLRSFVHPPPLLALWPAGGGMSQEDYLFPGVTVTIVGAAGAIGVAIAGLRRRSRGGDSRESWQAARAGSCILFYGSAALLMFALALGPGGATDGPPSLWRPYTWLLWLPGYDGLRVPARFAMPGSLCLAVAASCSLARFLRSGGGSRAIVGAVVVAAMGLEGLTVPMPMVLPPPRIALSEAGDAAVLEIPADDVEVSAAAMYRAMFHGRPLINGYSGHTPPHYAVLSLALWRGDTSVLHYLARDRPLAIVVNRAADRNDGFRRMIESIPEISSLNISGAGPVFLLPREAQSTPGRSDPVLPCKSEDVEPRRLRLDCGESRLLSAIEFALRGRYEELAERVLIEASGDGERWREVWLGWTGEFALDAVLRDPMDGRVRIAFRPTRARYLRVYPAPSWMSEDIQVKGR